MKSIVAGFVLAYLRMFARLALRLHRPQIIGITGSVGKSSARSLIYAAIRDHVATSVIEKGNSETGLPLGILGLAPNNYTPADWLRMIIQAPLGVSYLSGKKYLIAEMGIDDPYPPKNMGYLLTILDPEIAVFLNVYPVHTMQFDKVVDPSLTDPVRRADEILKAIAREKGKIVTDSHCRVAVYNADNRYVSEVVRSADRRINFFSYGQSRGNRISYESYRVSTDGTTFTFEFDGKQVPVELKGFTLPEEYREIIAAALMVAVSIGIDIHSAVRSLQRNFSLPHGRGSLFQGVKDTIIIDSSYNASKASIMAFLDLTERLAKQSRRPVTFIMGDMRELGEEAETEHREVAARIKEVVDELYLVGPLTRQYVMPEVRDTVPFVKHFPNSIAAGEYVRMHVKERSIVLVKGSQNTIFLEEAVKRLLADKNDESHLCRQEDFWMKMKQDVTSS